MSFHFIKRIGSFTSVIIVFLLSMGSASAQQNTNQPVKKTRTTGAPVKASGVEEVLSDAMTYTGSTNCYGMYDITNQSSKELTLLLIKGTTNSYAPKTKISSGETICTARLRVVNSKTITTAADCRGSRQNFVFWFTIGKGDATQYASITLPVEAGMKKAVVVNDGNLNFSATKPKF